MIKVETGVGEFHFDTVEELTAFIESTMDCFKKGSVRIIWDKAWD